MSGSSFLSSEVRFQPDLSRLLQELPPSRPHLLLVSGPEGCGQSSAARQAALLRSGADAPLLRLLPGEVDGLSAAEALDRLRSRWDAAASGVLLVSRLHLLLALPYAPLLLEAMWRWSRASDAPTLMLCGDRESADVLLAASPRLFWSCRRAEVFPLRPGEMAALLASMLSGEGLRLEQDEIDALEVSFRSVLQPGDLVNSRLVRALPPLIAEASAEGLPLDLAALSAVQSFSVTDASSALEDLELLIGLDSVKEQVRRLARNASLQHRRRALGIDVSGMGHHMVFAGPAGTAKTTVARIVGRILRESGVLPSGHMVEVQRADIVASDSASTSRRMVEKVQRAFGGVLFIDEAYTLTASSAARTEGEDMGREALETLMKMMEDYRDRFVVVVAGYPKEMDAFLNSNPGLRSRFSHNLLFPSYDVPQLMRILELQASERGYRLDEDVEGVVSPHLQVSQHYPGFGNGRYVRTLLESAIVRQGERLEPSSSDEELCTLRAEDFEQMVNAGHRFGLT